ncbi:MAG: pyridoxamine 5'-phosphate oxidase family protein [Gammaproteobacteria bacterium]|nr:pyridoxamine 5'-phosphate oxidase family protein [Gammaproteobacteria bacterium]
MTQKNETMMAQAQDLLLGQSFGVLSSHSTRQPSYPHGSVLPYIIDTQGCILILVSRLALHTTNMRQNPKVSLFVMADTSGDVQNTARLSLSCDALALSSQRVDSAAEQYYRRFPQSAGYHVELDFDFYELHIKEVGFIKGFGGVCYFDSTLWLKNLKLKGAM